MIQVLLTIQTAQLHKQNKFCFIKVTDYTEPFQCTHLAPHCQNVIYLVGQISVPMNSLHEIHMAHYHIVIIITNYSYFFKHCKQC